MNKEELILIIELIYKGEVRVEKEQVSKVIEISHSLSIDLTMPTGNKNNSILYHLTSSKQTIISIQTQVTEPPRKKQKIAEVSKILFLPPEILTRILSHLPTSDLLQNVALVSSYFNQLANSPKVHLNVSFSEISDETGAINFLQKAILIKELQITAAKFWQWQPQRKKISDYKKLLAAISTFSHLKTVEVCGAVTLETFVLLKKSKWWKRLTRIQMCLDYEEKDPLLVQEFDLVIKDFGSKSKMKKFCLFGKNLQFKSEHYATVVKENKDTLEDVNIDANCKETNDQILADLARCPNLKSLLMHKVFSFEYISKMRNLTTLKLNFTRAPHSELVESINQMKLPNLTQIRICAFRYPGNGTDQIALAFAQSCPNLTFFIISQVSLDFPLHCLLDIAL